MTPFLAFAILLVSVWTLVRSLEGLMGRGGSEARTAARNRVDRRQGLRLVEALREKADVLAASATGKPPGPDGDRIAALDERIAAIEEESERLLESETRREKRIRDLVYAMDCGFAAIGVAGIVVSLVAFVMLLG